MIDGIMRSPLDQDYIGVDQISEGYERWYVWSIMNK